MTPVIGVDGCPGGWIAVSLDGAPDPTITCRSFAELLAL